MIRSELSQEQVDRIAAESSAKVAAPLGYMAVNYRKENGDIESAAFLAFDPGTIAEPKVVDGQVLSAEDADGLLVDKSFLRYSGLDVGDTVTIFGPAGGTGLPDRG